MGLMGFGYIMYKNRKSETTNTDIVNNANSETVADVIKNIYSNSGMYNIIVKDINTEIVRREDSENLDYVFKISDDKKSLISPFFDNEPKNITSITDNKITVLIRESYLIDGGAIRSPTEYVYIELLPNKSITVKSNTSSEYRIIEKT